MRSSANCVRLGWVMLLVCAIASCRGVSAGDSRDDTNKWQRTWKLISSTYDGQPQMADMERIVDGDHYNIRLDQKLNPDPYTITLDPCLKHIDVFHHDTRPRTFGGKLKGIYEVTDDSLTVCYDLTEQGYPNSFDANRGSPRVLYKFRRE